MAAILPQRLNETNRASIVPIRLTVDTPDDSCRGPWCIAGLQSTLGEVPYIATEIRRRCRSDEPSFTRSN